MEENIKSLIEKIQQEGIEVAQEKAAEIKAHAENEAQAILAKARIEAKKLKEEAVLQNQREETSTRAALTQASRDMVLVLRKEI
ncbi:MAG: hypothetical protein KKC84_03645, partial [Candidatus Omnitrophica bacterium]|nr:hypothetical protein [Candidatus Omnitrophota bacterium]